MAAGTIGKINIVCLIFEITSLFFPIQNCIITLLWS